MACEGRALPQGKCLTGILETDGGWLLGSFGDKLNGNMDKFIPEGTVRHRRNGDICVESRLADSQNPRIWKRPPRSSGAIFSCGTAENFSTFWSVSYSS